MTIIRKAVDISCRDGVGRALGLVPGRPGFESQFSQTLVAWLWAKPITRLSLSFLNCKTMMIRPAKFPPTVSLGGSNKRKSLTTSVSCKGPTYIIL